MQTSYAINPVAGNNGQISSGRPSDVITAVTEGTLVKAGLFLVAGATAESAKAPAATWASTPEKMRGICVLDPARVDPTSYAAGETISVLRKGTIWVTFEPDTTPTVDTPVFARITANGAGKLTLGAIRANADTANAVAIPNCYFRQVVGTLAEIEINI